MLVIDASAALQWVFRDEASPSSDSLFERVAAEGATVPAIFHIELANVLVQAEKRGRINAAYASERLGVLAELPIAIDVESAARAWRETIALARAEGLTAYDASYLELAIRLGLAIASRDKDLIAAARRRGVTVLP
jgi:predicted nucleic acid-binding protein